MSSTLFIRNDAACGNERAYNAQRLAAALSGKDDQQLCVVLMADAVACGKAGQKQPEDYYNIQRMLAKLLRKWGSCLVRHMHG
jgi:uncharacterized protein involved in oxidation of intracellular sulfur